MCQMSVPVSVSVASMESQISVGATGPVTMEGRLNAVRYQDEVLQPVVVQEDNDHLHRTRDITDYLQNVGVERRAQTSSQLNTWGIGSGRVTNTTASLSQYGLLDII